MTVAMPATVAELMASRGLPVAEKDLVAALDEALIGRTAPRHAGALSGAAQQVLDEHGGLPSPSPTDAAATILTSTAGHLIALIETSLTGEQAAELLGVDASTVRGRISRGELYAIRVGRKNRLPRWQFTADGALPHLAGVLHAAPADIHPLEIEALFDLPTPDLILGGRDSSPRTWLAGGGDPTPVLELAAGLAVSP